MLLPNKRLSRCRKIIMQKPLLFRQRFLFGTIFLRCGKGCEHLNIISATQCKLRRIIHTTQPGKSTPFSNYARRGAVTACVLVDLSIICLNQRTDRLSLNSMDAAAGSLNLQWRMDLCNWREWWAPARYSTGLWESTFSDSFAVNPHTRSSTPTRMICQHSCRYTK